MNRDRSLLAAGIALAAAAATSIWAYSVLPAQVATHWNLHGQVNGHSSRLFALTLTPAIAAVAWLFMLVLPKVSPRGFRLDESADAFYATTLAIVVLLVATHIMLIRSAVTGAPPSMTLLFVGIGILLVVVGAYMGRIKRNFWIGIRTPWTLASDRVWDQTNALGGRLFMAIGIVTVIASFFGIAAAFIMVAAILLSTLSLVLYSYLVYRNVEGFDSDATIER